MYVMNRMRMKLKNTVHQKIALNYVMELVPLFYSLRLTSREKMIK